MEIDEQPEQAKAEGDAASQESDFELDDSDVSDAAPEGDLENELADLAPRPSKRVRRIPPRLASGTDDKHSDSDRGTPADNRSSMDTDENVGKRPKGRPRKSKLAAAAQEAQPAKKADKPDSAGQTTEFAVLQHKLKLAKTQLVRLRYAAADCNIVDYALKVHNILSPHMDPHARWDEYSALATEVDDVLKARSLEPVFMRNDVMHAVLPLFSLGPEYAPQSVNGVSSAATSRQPGTGKSTMHTSATSASSTASARFAQSEQHAKGRAGAPKSGLSSSRVNGQGIAKKPKPPRASNGIPQATRPAGAGKQVAAPAVAPPAAVCFFCSVCVLQR